MKRRDALKNSMWLTAAGLSVGTISAMMSGCKSDSKDLEQISDKILAQKHIEMIDAATQIIMPTTDTPGAKEANIIGDFSNHIEYNFSSKDRANFIKGLESIDDTSTNMFDASFTSLSSDKKESVLNAVADKGGESNIFETLKGMTVYLFFTSEIGATKVLNYLPIPGKYQPCVDLASVGNTWAL